MRQIVVERTDELIQAVAEHLSEYYGIPAYESDNGCGEPLVQYDHTDGWYSMMCPEEEDGRRWYVSLDKPNGDYAGGITTELLSFEREPTVYEIAEGLAEILDRVYGPFHESPSEEKKKFALEDAEHNGFWAKIVEHFPEVRTGDFDPMASARFEQALREALDHWLESNHPAYRFERYG